MATYDSRVVKGWRSRMADEAAELRRRIWQAPAQVVHVGGMGPPKIDDLFGHERWFHREFGEERAYARAELKRFKSAQARVARSEWNPEKREAYNAANRARYATQSAEWYEARIAQNRAWRAAQSPEYKAKANAKIREWRAQQSDEWRRAEAAKKRARRAADPERYKAIDRRNELRRKDERNAQRRAAYAADPEAHRAKLNARRAANREQERATARAAYARRKLSQLASD